MFDICVLPFIQISKFEVYYLDYNYLNTRRFIQYYKK